MFILLSSENSVSGALITLILAIAAAVPLFLRLYFKQKKYEQRTAQKRLLTEKQLEEKKIKAEQQLKAAELKQQKREADQQLALEKKRLQMEAKKADKTQPKEESAVSKQEPVLLEDQTSKKIERMADVELFKEKAAKLGCTEDMSLGDMAKHVLSYAPENYIAQLPENMPDEEKAIALLGAYKTESPEEVSNL